MDSTQIEKWAREVAMFFARDHFGDVPEIETDIGRLTRFAELVEKRIRQECADECIRLGRLSRDAFDCAAAIRKVTP